MAEKAIKKINEPEQVKWLKENYSTTVKKDDDLKLKLVTKLCERIEKGEGACLETLRDFLVMDMSLVDVLSHDYEYNLKASLVVRMRLHRFIQPVEEFRQVALNVVEILKTSYFLSNPSNYVETGPGGADPSLLYPESSCPTDATMLISQGQQQLSQQQMMGMAGRTGIYAPAMQSYQYPYSIPTAGDGKGIQNPNMYVPYPGGIVIPPQQQVMSSFSSPLSGSQQSNGMYSMVPSTQSPQLPFPMPGQHHLIYLDHNPDNNKKLVASLREHGTFVYVITSPEEFRNFVAFNYNPIISHISQGNSLRIMCDRLFASDFNGDSTGVDIIRALNEMGLVGIKILVYCWRIELVAHLAKFGVVVTKDIKVARDFGNFLQV